MFIALANLITTSWMHMYQIDLNRVSECLHFSIIVEHTYYDTIHKFLSKMFKSFVDSLDLVVEA